MDDREIGMSGDTGHGDRALRQNKKVRDFFYHLMTYLFVNALLIVIDLQADGGRQVLGLDWAYWVILGWGIGLAGHAISVFFSDDRAALRADRGR